MLEKLSTPNILAAISVGFAIYRGARVVREGPAGRWGTFMTVGFLVMALLMFGWGLGWSQNVLYSIGAVLIGLLVLDVVARARRPKPE